MPRTRHQRGCASAAVVGDGPLFAAEVTRIVTQRAVLTYVDRA